MDRLLEHDEIPADFESCFQTAFAFLGNPQKLWYSGGLEEKRLVLKLAFKSQLAYTRNRGFQTAAQALPFEVLAGFRGVKSEMVGGAVCAERVSVLNSLFIREYTGNLDVFGAKSRTALPSGWLLHWL